MKQKLIRITTVPMSLSILLKDQLTFMSNYYHVIAVSSDEKNLHQVGLKNGIDTFCVKDLTRKITPFHDLLALWNMYRFFRKEKPLIVHTHTPKAGFIGMVAAKLARVPNRLHTVAGLPLLEAKKNKRWILKIIERITYRFATKVYPNSTGLKKVIVDERICTIDKLNVLANGSSNGINTNYFDPNLFDAECKRNLRRRLSIKEEDFIFIFVGRIVKDKGINELVNAFCSLCKKTSKIKLLLVGNIEPDLDPLDKDTEEKIRSNKNIITTGFREDVRPYLSISNLLVFPSYREGFPNVVLQAGAMALPSIVSNINGCNEIIIEGVNGNIIPLKDAIILEKAMKELLIDNKLYETMRNNAREMIVSRYQQKVIWDAILSEYRSLEHLN